MVSFGPRCRAAPARIVDLPRSCPCQRYLLVSFCLPRTDGIGSGAPGKAMGRAIMRTSNLAALLENFFVERMINQRQASPYTISSYRDTFRLLLQFAQRRLHKPPSRLALEDLDAPMITAFLNDLESNRKISARSRNLRLTAIRSFFHYAAYEEPAHASQIQRVLAIPGKRYSRTFVQFLNRPEVDALLAAPDQRTWLGRRDHALLLVAVQTGLRLSELTG